MRGAFGLVPAVSLAISACKFEPGTFVPPTGDADAPADGSRNDVLITNDAGIQEVTVAVASSSDDALQDPAPGAVLVMYPWTSLYTADHWGGLRFVLPQVARGATIVEADLDVYIDSPSEDDPHVSITSEASANPAAFVMTNNSISSRPRGASSTPCGRPSSVRRDRTRRWSSTPPGAAPS